MSKDCRVKRDYIGEAGETAGVDKNVSHNFMMMMMMMMMMIIIIIIIIIMITRR